ncbi:MAG: hypothetical protein V1735_00265 [Nanoarchaeota archaeon]
MKDQELTLLNIEVGHPSRIYSISRSNRKQRLLSAETFING